MLIDKVKIYVRAGNGGHGCESYECRGPRKYYPTGGHGGKGGDIIFRAETNVRDLEHFKFNPRIIGNNAAQGGSNRKAGKKGDDILVKVPVGTTISSADGSYLIRDLACHGDEVIVAQGGNGGRGNQDNKTATKGRPGQELEVVLDYTISADISILGLANSGKTTLLSRLTHAKVESTDYPFSTKAPQLGSYECDDYKRLIFLDMPSLIKGSHRGRGNGNRFIKHALRSKVLFILVEPVSEFAENAVDAVSTVLDELQVFDTRLIEKESFIIINKDDLDQSGSIKKLKDRLKKKYKNVYNVSARSGNGIDLLMQDVEAFIRGEDQDDVAN
jgi:GTPase